MRQIVLDTETTGLEPEAGHRIIEIGCVEIVNRRPTNNRFHRYVNPGRAVDAGALQVHGIENDFLATQPRFAEIAPEFLEFVKGAELVIHNADFDVNFLNHELSRLEGVPHQIRDCCGVLDTLALARRMHPGQRNSLDALAKRYNVDNSARNLHGALLDAQILTDIYLLMTGGQVSLSLDSREQQLAAAAGPRIEQRVDRHGLDLVVLRATADEVLAHDALLAKIAKRCGRALIWPVTPDAVPGRDAVPAVAELADAAAAAARSLVRTRDAGAADAAGTPAPVPPLPFLEYVEQAYP